MISRPRLSSAIGPRMRLLQRRGAGYGAYFLGGVLLPRAERKAVEAAGPAKLVELRRAVWEGDPLGVQRRREDARRLTLEVTRRASSTSFVAWADLQVPESTRTAVDAQLAQAVTKPAIIGSFDQDGHFTDVGGAPVAVLSSYPARSDRHQQSSLVVFNEVVYLQRHYRGHQRAFVNAWYLHAYVSRHAGYPALHHVDEDTTSIFTGVLPGRSMREALQAVGPAEDRPASSPVRMVEDAMNRLHAVGVAGVSLDPADVLLADSEGACLINLARAHVHRRRTEGFHISRDVDRERFNALYEGDLVTERVARRALMGLTSKPNEAAPASSWYGAIDFGRGLTVGQVWSVDAGTGRWEYLNRRVMAPLMPGARVLDLGSNNGVMPMMMLRAGAREVVGLEYSPEHVTASRVVHRLFEWRDLATYPFTVHNVNMADGIQLDLGKFDVVTALCSLYYLPVADMARVVRRAAELAPVLVLQGNTETPPADARLDEDASAPDDVLDSQHLKSSAEFLERTLKENGFGVVDVHAPDGFSRPLLVGRRSEATTPDSATSRPG